MVARIAMWSGPRTISTAMLRAWGARADCQVVDEPLYAYYLDRTGLDHPGREDILGAQPTDWRAVVAGLASGPVPPGCAVYYQKHMTHHVLPEVELSTMDGLRHAFLIRDPELLLASYAEVRTAPTLADLGLPQQVELFERFGGPVLDSQDVLADPERMLRALCSALDVAFDPAMLSWPAGRSSTDGVWAEHWYAGVWASTGFRAPRAVARPGVPEGLRQLLAQCRPYYETMAAHRLTG